MLGRTLVNALGNTKHPIDSPVGKKGTTIVAPHRGTDDDKRHLKVMADLGKLVQTVFILAYSDYNLVQRYDLRNDESVYESLNHSSVVYNCIGRSFSTKNFSYDSLHNQHARKLAKIAREAGVEKFIHVSALGADVDSKSQFLKSKVWFLCSGFTFQGFGRNCCEGRIS